MSAADFPYGGGNLGAVFNVKNFGAVGFYPTFGNDDTAAINAAINAVTAAGGGILYFPKGVYAVSSTLQIGNATSTVRSVPIAVVGDGGGVEPGPGQSTAAANQALLSGLRAPTTIVALPGFSGSVVMQFNGPGVFQRIADFAVNAQGNATNCILMQSVNKTTVRRVTAINPNGGYGFWITTNPAFPENPSGDEIHYTLFESLATYSAYENSIGCIIGDGVGSLPVDISLCSFLNCEFNVLDWGFQNTNTIGCQIQFADNNFFFGLVALGTKYGVYFKPPSSRHDFPAGNVFYALLGASGHGIDWDPSWAPGFGGGAIVVSLQTGGGSGVPPWDTRLWVITDGGQQLGPVRATSPYVTGTAAAQIGNTNAETAFPYASGAPPRVPAGALTTRGTAVRLRLAGRYNSSGTSGLTLRIRVYMDAIGAGNLLYDTGAVAVAARTGEPWKIDAEMVTYTSGNPGNLINANGSAVIENGAISLNRNSSGLTGNFDLTAAHSLVVTAQWSLAEAANTIGLSSFSLDFQIPSLVPAF